MGGRRAAADGRKFYQTGARNHSTEGNEAGLGAGKTDDHLKMGGVAATWGRGTTTCIAW